MFHQNSGQNQYQFVTWLPSCQVVLDVLELVQDADMYRVLREAICCIYLLAKLVTLDGKSGL